MNKLIEESKGGRSSIYFAKGGEGEREKGKGVLGT